MNIVRFTSCRHGVWLRKYYVNCLLNFLHCVLTHAALFDSRSSHFTHR